jgi:hypothetical protein
MSLDPPRFLNIRQSIEVSQPAKLRCNEQLPIAARLLCLFDGRAYDEAGRQIKGPSSKSDIIDK